MKGSSNLVLSFFSTLKIVNTPHLLEMATAKMKPTIIIAPLMVATVVDLVYSQNIAQIVNVTMKLPAMEFRMLLLEMVSVMMRPTI